ncbi:efflux RND transporter periplasmic adaptor subunit [Gracilinema caldarium]|uniref:Efflux transporter, RND family, MFP subunit n=1 Tax=Gracilinema caldarium (strain ATCC 51460 / DSM 7334 / H1) TaxID=744872 RepID=F8EYT9_GRAC1|nr:efflux RND transporter periplasmic adaptor subunit [Gracilinema caldarium]AEJ18885.1 efflux transporter, RND family, MFP subunit [Gracilinema caldarium DSM 7334]
MNRRNFVIFGIFIILIGAILLLPRNQSASQSKTKPAFAQQAVNVKTELVNRKNLQDYIITNGEVTSETIVSVYPFTSGKIDSLLVYIGSEVSKGDIIAYIDPSKPGTAYALNPVLSPISGTVLELPLQIGATVSTNSSIATIGVLDKLEIVTSIPERYSALMKTGLTASISFEALPDHPFSADVIRVSPILDSTSRTRKVYLKIKGNPDPRLVIGMYARIRLNTVFYPNRIVISEKAINTLNGTDYVFVVKNDNTVNRRGIVKGVTIDGMVEIISGLEENERVVIEGAQNLTDGILVHDVESGEN